MMFLFQSYTFTVAFNRTMVHSLPVMMNVISNLYLHSLNVTESISIWSSPFFQVSEYQPLKIVIKLSNRTKEGDSFS